MKSILTDEEIDALCEMCGRCCIASEGEILGGTEETDEWLRMPNGECRFLLPNKYRGCRFCTIYDDSDLRPELCQKSPTVGNINYLPDCPVTKVAREKLNREGD